MRSPVPDELEVLASEANDEEILVPLGPDRILIGVLPHRQWRASALEDLDEGRLRQWSEKCLTDEGLDRWEDLDPTVEEIGEFFSEFRRLQGIDPLASRESRRSSRRIRRR